MNSETTIRAAKEKDLNTIGRLWIELMDFHKVRDSHFTRSSDGREKFLDYIKGHMSSGDSYVIVAEYSGDVVSYCLAHVEKKPPVFKEEKYGLVCDLAVSGPFRRKGIGEHMFLSVKRWFKRKGVERIEVRAVLSNEISTKFWRKMGFSPYIQTLVKGPG